MVNNRAPNTDVQAAVCLNDYLSAGWYHRRGFFFGNDPRDFYEPKVYTQLGEPARYGMTLEWQY